MKSLMKIENFKIGEIIERINKFVVKVKIDNKIVFTHLNNTGRLEEFIRKGRLGIFLPIKGKEIKFRLSMIIDENLQTNKDSSDKFASKEDVYDIRVDSHKSSHESSHQFASTSHQFALKKDARIDSRNSSHKFASSSIIDTSLQMKCFEIALEKGYLTWLKGAKILKRNLRINNSLIDYLIEYRNKKYLLEVKSAVMKKGIYAMYPDCPSLRGQKHIKELINIQLLSSSSLVSNSASSASVQCGFIKSELAKRTQNSQKNTQNNQTTSKSVSVSSVSSALVQRGFASIILFIAGMKNIKAFKPNKDADPKIYELLKIAKQKGVKIKAIQIYFDLKRKEIIIKNDDLRVEI